MIKKYSFPTEIKAFELINLIAEGKPTVTEHTKGIAYLGFQNEYEFNEETEESVLIKAGETYDVDIFWRVTPFAEFTPYEVNPVTPSHRFI